MCFVSICAIAQNTGSSVKGHQYDDSLGTYSKAYSFFLIIHKCMKFVSPNVNRSFLPAAMSISCILFAVYRPKKSSWWRNCQMDIWPILCRRHLNLENNIVASSKSDEIDKCSKTYFNFSRRISTLLGNRLISAALSPHVQAVVHSGPLLTVIWWSHSPALRQCRPVHFLLLAQKPGMDFQ